MPHALKGNDKSRIKRLLVSQVPDWARWVVLVFYVALFPVWFGGFFGF